MIQHSDPVFPLPLSRQGEGIDLRTWMATQFMAAMVSGFPWGDLADSQMKMMSQDSVKCTDLLISELNKTPEVAP